MKKIISIAVLFLCIFTVQNIHAQNSNQGLVIKYTEILTQAENETELPAEVAAAFENEDAQIKLAAIQAVKELKDKRAIPYLVKCLDDNEYIANQAGMALAAIGDESVIPDLLSRIGEDNAPTGVALSEFGVNALKAITERMDVQGKSARRDAKSKEERFRMIQAIGFFKDPESIPYLKELLKHKDADVRASAVQSLGNMGALNIAEAIKDNDPIVRLHVVDAARKIQDDSINPLLIDVFGNDKNSQVRCITANVLADRKCREAVPYFEEELNHRNKEIRMAVEAALIKIRRDNNE
jgi:HEAT repeat protein